MRPISAHAVTPDDTATIPCPVCAIGFAPSGRRRFCSDMCRRRAWATNRRVPPTPVVVAPPAGPRRPVTVYECDACGERALGVQYCDDCRTWMRRIGIGGSCRECEAPIAVCELVDVVEPTGRRR